MSTANRKPGLRATRRELAGLLLGWLVACLIVIVGLVVVVALALSILRGLLFLAFGVSW